MNNKICDICGKEVDIAHEKKMYPHHWDSAWTINAGVVGEAIELNGHRVCLQNVDNKVVIPARIGLSFWVRGQELRDEMKKKRQEKQIP